eukprot:scaffold244584_cov42-Prasinocladus_malaysianus.AAC.1
MAETEAVTLEVKPFAAEKHAGPPSRAAQSVHTVRKAGGSQRRGAVKGHMIEDVSSGFSYLFSA